MHLLQDRQGEDETDFMQRTLAGAMKAGKKDIVQALHEELAQRPDEEATTMAMKLMRAIQPRAAQVKDWDRVQAVLVAHTGKKGIIWCGGQVGRAGGVGHSVDDKSAE